VLIWIYGIMFFLGMKMNAMTAIIGSLTIGLGITYAIHITQRFVEDVGKIEDIDKACRVTVRHTGTALVGAGTTTIAAFGTLMLSSMPPAKQFGGIVALTIFLSFMASVFILPTFLVMWAKWRKEKGLLHQKASTNIRKSESQKPEPEKLESKKPESEKSKLQKLEPDKSESMKPEKLESGKKDPQEPHR